MLYILIATLILRYGYAASTGDELKALRDDIRAVCWKAYNPNGAKHCRGVGDSDSQRHIVNECQKSGWSGAGSLRCKYGMDIHGTNTQGAGDSALHNGAHGGRRLEVDSDGVGSGMADDTDNFGTGVDTDIEAPVKVERAAPGLDFFDMKNVEDEETTNDFGLFSYTNSMCVLQGMKAIESEKVDPECLIKPNEAGFWELKQTSANCYVFCYPLQNKAHAL